MKFFIAAALCSVSATAAIAAEPAMVNKVVGKNVTWQHGDASAAPRVQTLLAPGDRLTAGKGSYVEVEYLADNCKVRVDAGSSLTISETSPCAAATQKAASAAPEDVQPAPVATTAQVTEKQGPVTRVNLGEGLVDVAVGSTLSVGDEVFAGQSSSVTLYFAGNKCSFTVQASSVYTLADEAPCEATTAVGTVVVPAAVTAGSTTGTVITGGAAGTASTGAGLVAGGFTTGAAVAAGVGAAAVAGAVAVIATSDSGGSNNKPATPD
jgi:hypothetical protein